MVNDDAQLYTMEGFAGAIILVVTAYLVLGTTSVYTPGDTHITDMQLEQLGSDALKMMDTPNTFGVQSELVACVNKTLGDRFAYNFTRYLRSTAIGPDDSQVQFTADVFYRNSSGIFSYRLAGSGRPYIGREPAVRVTRWVTTAKPSNVPGGIVISEPGDPLPNRPRVMLVEVMLWRG